MSKCIKVMCLHSLGPQLGCLTGSPLTTSTREERCIVLIIVQLSCRVLWAEIPSLSLHPMEIMLWYRHPGPYMRSIGYLELATCIFAS